VVDDHPGNPYVLVRQLDLLGIPADAADDGAAAFKAWSRGGYAAMLTDLHMPEMDGYELSQRIREPVLTRKTNVEQNGLRQPALQQSARPHPHPPR
jgi:CheY-like chemotaxis protein